MKQTFDAEALQTELQQELERACDLLERAYSPNSFGDIEDREGFKRTLENMQMATMEEAEQTLFRAAILYVRYAPQFSSEQRGNLYQRLEAGNRAHQLLRNKRANDIIRSMWEMPPPMYEHMTQEQREFTKQHSGVAKTPPPYRPTRPL